MNKPNLKNYTTRVGAEDTAAQIISLLVRHGAQKVMQDFDDGEVTAITRATATPHGIVGFRLPIDVERCYAVLMEQRLLPRDTQAARQQARRVAWRIVKDWVDAQMALLQTQMVSLDQLMLPYAVGRDGQTVYEHMVAGGYQHYALVEGKETNADTP